MSDTTDHRAQLWDMIHDIKFAMFVTRHGNGHLHSRPMTTQNRDMDADMDKHPVLWFFMSRKGDPVADLASEAAVNLSYADTSKDRYVSVSGTARIADDPAMKQALWSKMAQAWFPGGVDDPDLALVGVTVAHAHYWDIKESKITQLYAMAKAAVTGQPPTSLGESAEVRLDGTAADANPPSGSQGHGLPPAQGLSRDQTGTGGNSPGR